MKHTDGFRNCEEARQHSYLPASPGRRRLLGKAGAMAIATGAVGLAGPPESTEVRAEEIRPERLNYAARFDRAAQAATARHPATCNVQLATCDWLLVKRIQLGEEERPL